MVIMVNMANVSLFQCFLPQQKKLSNKKHFLNEIQLIFIYNFFDMEETLK